MRHLPNLLNGKLTAYQIATATGNDIHIIEALMDGSQSIESLDESIFLKLSELEEDLFSTSTDKKETSA
ncbi:hypothetical protein ERX37_00920 [Macrococcus hajekii]|uniref:XRE family transcriptional regulator n=1 Tax=Macrococcus hajekii TaxID=198482 RepID=A0A4R6BM17_9STAP|nr:hypothetical protein [Macrococcus hajekii]TDM02682.1 hypothetical protein ERX37_00920 [Macrococcus hajekii]GGB03024.1 hypothetical protein GCM10007190_08770 [Macrococcus hajekii]